MVGHVETGVPAWGLRERIVKGSLNLDFYDFIIYEIESSRSTLPVRRNVQYAESPYN